MRFFRPDPVRLILLAMFLFIALFGWRESAAFSGGSAPATALWASWMALLAPLGLLLLLLRKAGLPLDLFRAAPAVFWLAQVLYFYVLACAIAWLAAALLRKFRAPS
jgi:hypothetical protein